MSFPFSVASNQGDPSPSQTDPFYDLYRYYIDLVVRFNAYYFTIMGALLTYAATTATTDAISANFLLLAIPLVLSVLQCINYAKSLKLSNEIHEGKVSFLRKATFQSKETNGSPDDSYLKDNPLSNILWSFFIVHVALSLLLLSAMWHYYQQSSGVIGSASC